MLVQTIATFLARHVPSAAPLVVAVSGGADSLALLHGLAACVPAERLIVAHLDHGLRGAAAHADAAFVAQTAAALGCRFVGAQRDVAAQAQVTGESIETAARRARYAFLATTAAQHAADWVLTGHSADDQAETVLMHLLRGSGLHGLGGMRLVAPLPYADAPMMLGRPLLNVWRSAIEAYCAAHGLQPRRDATNDDPTYTRNQIRHQLLPLLAHHAPDVRQRLTDLAQLAAADDDWLADQGAAALTACTLAAGDGWRRLDRARWQALPLALRRRVLRQAIAQLAADVAAEGVALRALEAARALAETGAVGQRAALPGDAQLTLGYDDVQLTAAGVALPDAGPQIDGVTPLNVGTETTLANGWTLTAHWLATADLATVATNADRWQAYLGVPQTAALAVRARRTGERVQPLGLGGGSTSLKELMIDRKLPAALRARWPLLTADDQVVWVVGHVVAQTAAVTPHSAHVLHIICRPPLSRAESRQSDAG